jgi:hypothetical protein
MRLKASRDSEQYQTTNSSIAYRYPRRASGLATLLKDCGSGVFENCQTQHFLWFSSAGSGAVLLSYRDVASIPPRPDPRGAVVSA